MFGLSQGIHQFRVVPLVVRRCWKGLPHFPDKVYSTPEQDWLSIRRSLVILSSEGFENV